MTKDRSVRGYFQLIEIAGFDTTNHVSLLQHRWLQDNNITELPPELFQDLENLQEL